MVKVLSVNGKIPLVDGKAISATGGGGGGSTVELDTTLSEAGKAADAKAVGDALAGKVDKVTGKGLSSNDYTDAAKAKVDALAPVATSGNYNDLTNKPTIPTVLPNPHKLTINGTEYDGSTDVQMTIEGGGSSVPKPLTYDYMPEGYPKKSIQTTTLLEEQEIAFSNMGRLYLGVLTDAFSLTLGQTYAVNWDGTEYECVCSEFQSSIIFGNLSIMGVGEDTGEPFIYSPYDKSFVTLDAAPSHTISVVGPTIIYEKIDENFLPKYKYVSYEAQDLTDVEKETARNNINALDKDVLIEIPNNIVLASDFETYYKKYKKTGLPIKWNGNIITYIVDAGQTGEFKRYIINTGDRLLEFSEYEYNGEKRVAYSNATPLYDNLEASQISFHNPSYSGDKIISLNDLGDLVINNSNSGKLMIWDGGVVVQSCTAGSTKKFKITVDDTGTLSATEVTE